ncbi:3-deoxy-D-manno-octulosonic acid transferase [Lampropedia aestuarii]|uniref:3-deoxy-D-manno-octulosonic acid transferase n=1 Tax=Lampropedia aestuarii TaxID=2562762 RepID=UPI0024696393|nr:3-deoxy-D-manno-octulosonic acid transferase [Lampropedia aestuarii]MDH5855856.1 3-deoxy-D-manno-octulosonic acid transferase [Lampropedia aestuarii]
MSRSPISCQPVAPSLRWSERLALALYGVAITAASPLLRRKLRKRAVQEPGYAQAVPERFGYYESTAEAGGALLWVHAVSLGESRTAGLLIEALRQRIPGLRILLTHGTATGRAEGQQLLRAGDLQAWFPWDTPGAVKRFLAHFKPSLGLLMETEVWPSMVQACAQQGMPLWLVNARLNERSLAGIHKAQVLMGPAYRHLAGVLAQTDMDAERLQSVGAPVQGVTGNIKFDARPNPQQVETGLQLRATWTAHSGKPVVVLASSREGEEAAWLDAIAASPALHAVQWLVVPRHPQRFEAVAQLVLERGLSLQRRSRWTDLNGHSPWPTPAADIWLGDSMGEMALYYSIAQVALLGASFEALGGQNLIEACACACPVIMGPHTFNFTHAAQDALAQQAALRVADVAEAVQAAVALAHDTPRLHSMQQQAQHFAHAHRGALDAMADALAGQWALMATDHAGDRL